MRHWPVSYRNNIVVVDDEVIYIYTHSCIYIISYLATLYLIGNVIGSFASGWISASIGRKMAMFGSGFPLALSWLTMGLSMNSVELYVSSFCQGIFISISWTSVGKLNLFCLRCKRILPQYLFCTHIFSFNS